MAEEDPRKIVKVEETAYPPTNPDVQFTYANGHQQLLLNDELIGVGMLYNMGERVKVDELQKIRLLIAVAEGAIPGAIGRAFSGWPEYQREWLATAMEFNRINLP